MLFALNCIKGVSCDREDFYIRRKLTSPIIQKKILILNIGYLKIIINIINFILFKENNYYLMTRIRSSSND